MCRYARTHQERAYRKTVIVSPDISFCLQRQARQINCFSRLQNVRSHRRRTTPIARIAHCVLGQHSAIGSFVDADGTSVGALSRSPGYSNCGLRLFSHVRGHTGNATTPSQHTWIYSERNVCTGVVGTGTAKNPQSRPPMVSSSSQMIRSAGTNAINHCQSHDPGQVSVAGVPGHVIQSHSENRCTRYHSWRGCQEIPCHSHLAHAGPLPMKLLGCAGTIMSHRIGHMQRAPDREPHRSCRICRKLNNAGTPAAIVPSPRTHLQDRLRMQGVRRRNMQER